MIKANDLIKQQKEKELKKRVIYDKIYTLIEKKISLSSQSDNYYTLFLIPEDVYDTVRREVIEKRTEHHAQIPNVNMLFDGFTKQFQEQWRNARYQYAQWLTLVLETLLGKIEIYQNDILKQSEKLLVDMEKSIQSQTDQEVKQWKSLELEIMKLQKSVELFMKNYQKI